MLQKRHLPTFFGTFRQIHFHDYLEYFEAFSNNTWLSKTLNISYEECVLANTFITLV